MPKQREDEPTIELATAQREGLPDVIGQHVLRAVGRPGDWHRVQVRQLWEGRYRVNILVGPDAASARVAHSYFLTADGEGAILACTPAITRQYGPREGGGA